MKQTLTSHLKIAVFLISILSIAVNCMAQSNWKFDDEDHILDNNQYYDRADLFVSKASIILANTPLSFKKIQQQLIKLDQLVSACTNYALNTNLQNYKEGFRIIYGVDISSDNMEMKYFIQPIIFQAPVNSLGDEFTTTVIPNYNESNTVYDNSAYRGSRIFEIDKKGNLILIENYGNFNRQIQFYESSFALLDGFIGEYVDSTSYKPSSYGALSASMPLELIQELCAQNSVTEFYINSGISYDDKVRQVHSIEFSYGKLRNKLLANPPFQGYSANFSQLCPTKCNTLKLKDVSDDGSPTRVYKIIK